MWFFSNKLLFHSYLNVGMFSIIVIQYLLFMVLKKLWIVKNNHIVAFKNHSEHCGAVWPLLVFFVTVTALGTDKLMTLYPDDNQLRML